MKELVEAYSDHSKEFQKAVIEVSGNYERYIQNFIGSKLHKLNTTITTLYDLDPNLPIIDELEIRRNTLEKLQRDFKEDR